MLHFPPFWPHLVPGGTGRCPAACCESNHQEPFCGRRLVKNLDVVTRNLGMLKFFPLSGGTLCPAVLGGARRPGAKTVVKNPVVADSSSEESSCGDNKWISRCQIFLRCLVAPGARRHWAVPGGRWRQQCYLFVFFPLRAHPSSLQCTLQYQIYISLCASSPAPPLPPPPYSMLTGIKSYLLWCFYFLAHLFHPAVCSVVRNCTSLCVFRLRAIWSSLGARRCWAVPGGLRRQQ